MLMRNGVLDFLDRASVANFMTVEEFSKVFRLHRCFCKDHGMRLGQVWVPGPKKQCTDCEMAKIGRIRCGKCDDFSKWHHFSSCTVCNKSDCSECMDTLLCYECHEEFCYECKDSFRCEECRMVFCNDCEDMFFCGQCDKPFCRDHCKDYFYCEECEETFCFGCKDSFSCTQCEEEFCLGCRKSITCTGECENTFCSLECKTSSSCCSTKSNSLPSETS
jgi:hypothetical protein